MRKPRIAFLPIARNTFDIQLAMELSNTARKHLSQLRVSLVDHGGLITDLEHSQRIAASHTSDPIDLLLIFQATFADSSMIMAVAESADVPLILWAVPEDHSGGRLRLNSFCGINLAGHALTRAGYRYEHIFASPEDPAAIDKICALAKAGQTLNFLRKARLGRVGENPDGFETCLFDKDSIQNLLGIEVVQFDLAKDIFNTAQQVEPKKIDSVEQQLNEKVAGLNKLDSNATRGTLSARSLQTTCRRTCRTRHRSQTP